MADHVMASLNTDELLAIRDEEVLQPDRRLIDFKYFNIRPWIVENIKRALRLGLHQHRGRRILDIGTGFGYFPYICEFMEHQSAALDIPDHRLYDRVIDALKINRTHHKVNPFEPLPAPERPYDYVTAYQLAFNRPGTDEHWGAAEWAFFVEDVLNNQLKDGGRLHMELNWSFPINAWYDKETRKLFDKHQATRTGNEVDIVKR
ncbi:hypothetical protein ACS8Y6_09845 [Salinisphaera sp. RV14]|uniref:hypothetical protein n=1 Tax=Salinisphaera sp. RV14 TaxID=3454140 RepID=UPI003F83BEAE